MNKKSRSKTPFKPKSPFKWFCVGIIPATSPKILTNETTFSNYLLTVDAYSKIPKLDGMEIITTEDVMDKLDMFHGVFVKVDEFGWWDLEIISAYSGTQFTSVPGRIF